MEDKSLYPFMMKRDKVYRVFRQWINDGRIEHINDLTEHLWQLLGRAKREGIIGFMPNDTLNDDEMRVCEALAGPNGWAIYKALLARREP